MDMLHEDYETISLSEILSLRDAYLNEEELWALCRECCLTLEYVRDSQDLFQGLCITPETVAFDHSGSVCFLDLDEEPEALYIAPEFEDVGNSFKSHLFSLGMTMLYGIEYNIQTEEPKHELSSQLSDLLTSLCADGDKQRPSIEHVIRQCDEVLKEKSSQDICHCMIDNFIRGSPLQDGSSSILDLSAGLTSYLNTQSPHSPRQSTPQDLYQQTDVTTNHKPENISHDTEQSKAKTLFDENIKDLVGNQTESDEYLLSRLLTSENKDSKSSEKQTNNPDQFLITKLLDSSVPADTENCDEELAGLDISNINNADDENKENCDRSIVKEKSDSCNNYKPSETVIENSDSIIKNSDRKYSNILITGEMECLDLASILEITREKLDNLDLWSLISEGIIAIRKKKRHLPAFISPDTTVIKENGSIIFTGVPDGQKLETKYMAPELQQKGILSEKTCLYGLAMTLQTLSGNEDLDENLQDLLLSMLHSNCDKRPNINQALGICDNLQSMFDITSRQGCKILLQRAWNYYSDDDTDYQNNNSLHESELQESSIESNNNCIETVSSSRHERKTTAPTPVSAFKPIHPENSPKPVTIGSTSSAFKPVAVKPQTISKPKPVYEGNLSHTLKVKKEEEQTNGLNQGDVKQPEKAPKVMKKLKDLEKHLSRHRSVDESKFSDQETNEVNNNSDTSVDKNTNSDFNPGDSLSKLLQKFDGQLPDTETLATAIAQYLQTQISGTSQKSSVSCPSKGIDPEFSSSASPSLPKPDQTCSAGVVESSVKASPESSTAIQTFNMPIHNITGQTTSYPIQLQLQQDPKTGFVQLIPVGVMPYGSVVPQIAVPMNTGKSCDSEIEDDTIPDKHTNIQHDNVVGKPPIQTRIKQVVKKPTQPRSRTKSQGYMSDSGILEKSDNMEDGSFIQFPTNNARKQIRTLQNELELSFTGSHTSGTGHTKLNKTFLSDSGHFNQSNTGQRSFHQSGSRSANTSPSWSKDSGVSGLQPPLNTVGYNDKTLIERLLNTDGSQHQHILGEVLGVLRENHVIDDSDYDDFTVAEYITSLGNLRIDTFTGAVSEKYHQIEWSYSLLHTLYGIINHSHNRNKVLTSANTSTLSNSDHRRLSAPSYEQNQQFKSPPDSINTTNPELSASQSAVKYSPPLQSNPPELQRSHPLRSSLYRRTSGISETSDSTDTERKEKRRKFKKRYQLDRGKSSSLSNIINNSQNQSPEHNKLKCESESFIRDTNRSLTVEVPSPIGNEYHGDSSPGSVSMNLESDYVQLSGSIHDYENIDFTETPKQVSGRLYNRPVSDSYSIKSIQTQNGDQSKLGKIHRQDSFRQNKQFNRNLSKSESLQVAEVPKLYSERYCSPDEMSSNSSSNNIKSAPQGQTSNTSQYVPKIRKYDAKPNNNLTKRFVNKYSSDSESSRTDSLPLKARHDLGSQIQNGEKQASKKTLSTLLEKSEISLRRKIQVIYHWASVHTDFSGDLEEFSSHVDEGDKAGIEHQLLSVQQQLGMEKKMRRKSQKFYQKLIDPVKTFKDDQKGVASQVLKDLEEMTRKVHFLQLCQTHLQMLLSEFNGIHLQYSYSLSLDIVNEILSLKPYTDNPLLQFQYMVDPHSNCQIQVLQAGQSQALLAYLFITCAISNGFIHQFLYTYRYFVSSDSLLNFLIHRYTAASRSDPNDPRIECIKQRTLDILYYWMEGFYNIDFELNKTLLFRLEQFLMTQLSHNDDKQESISELLRLCSHGYKIKFNSSNDDKDEEETTLYLKLESPKKWNSFKSLTRRSPTKRVQSFKDLTIITKACNNNDIDDGFYPRITKRNDAFTLLDYTPQILVEQLTLITQEIFQQSHPIQYLNSKANGICVALSLPGQCTPSMIRRRASGGESKNLFLGQWMPSKILDELISLSQNISQWISGELVSCSNPKTQTQLLTKFINVAQIIEEIRNYSLCVSIIDGLENVIVRQLPIWRNISSKYITIMESLSKMKLKLKSEPFYLIQDINYTLYPTIPYTLYFLLHVQQIEMGSFTLANGFIKWTKMRTICQLIDQIRIFRSNEYGFEPNFDIQDNLLQRMEEFLHLDIQAIASQNDTNFRRMSTGGIQSVLRKMKDKLGKP